MGKRTRFASTRKCWQELECHSIETILPGLPVRRHENPREKHETQGVLDEAIPCILGVHRRTCKIKGHDISTRLAPFAAFSHASAQEPGGHRGLLDLRTSGDLGLRIRVGVTR